LRLESDHIGTAVGGEVHILGRPLHEPSRSVDERSPRDGAREMSDDVLSRDVIDLALTKMYKLDAPTGNFDSTRKRLPAALAVVER
jgi:hypothetical protein